MDLQLTDKRAFVTGGSHGIGLAIAKLLAQEGCHVGISGRSWEKLARAQHEIHRVAERYVHIFPCDVLQPEEITYTTHMAEYVMGSVDILINNVGGGGRWGKDDIISTDTAVWHEVYQKNAGAAVQFTRAFLTGMIEHNWGRVVTVTSRLGKEGGGRPWFNMAKAAEISLMKTLAMDHNLSGKGITFNSVAPGDILIEGSGFGDQAKSDPEMFEAYVRGNCPIGRMGTADEVASVVAFLSSNRASLVNGSCISVDGAQTRAF
jgi:3-oxoacyl-[acyl-carrier protein] reductase